MAEAAIIKYCFNCPVIAECDEYADSHDEIGIWGGKWRKRNTTGDDDEPILI